MSEIDLKDGPHNLSRLSIRKEEIMMSLMVSLIDRKIYAILIAISLRSPASIIALPQ